MAWTNASLTWSIRTWPAAPSRPATAYPPLIDSLAAPRADAGRLATCGATSLRYVADSTELRTATPSAPPTWRIVLLTAEPTPAFSRGRLDITDSVAGGSTLAIAAPWTKNRPATPHSRVSRPADA